MGNKPKWNEALSEAMRGQLGTTREVFTNSNGSNVILERSGDKWHHEIGTPDVDAEAEDDEPEDEGEEDEEGENNGTRSGGPSPGSKDRGPGLEPGVGLDGPLQLKFHFDDFWWFFVFDFFVDLFWCCFIDFMMH